MRILIVLPVKEKHREMFKKAAPGHELVYCPAEQVTKDMAASADVILGNVPVKLLKGCSRLKWIQLNNAGTEGFCEPGALPEKTILTNATGAYGTAISEHMIGMVFMLHKHLHEYYLQQQSCVWEKLGPMTVVDGSTTLVLGLGDIGTEFARRIHAMGSLVIGIRKSHQPKPDFVDEQYTMDALNDVLPRADIVAMSLPGYSQTRHIINKETLALMKPTAVLINVGRGISVDTDALCQALNEGRLGGACLDVTDPEPLPADHPLWKAKNALITPHASGGYALDFTLEKILKLCGENLERFIKGEPLLNQVDMETGYVKR
ncbi:MAG TPA: D-2-hydroxyacid dehydrogenase [Candidatus Scybalocola faecavium]|nr:D-2-hydroxyacid dehydrogenase [Candidatus Scybalocola faecavium]